MVGINNPNTERPTFTMLGEQQRQDFSQMFIGQHRSFIQRRRNNNYYPYNIDNNYEIRNNIGGKERDIIYEYNIKPITHLIKQGSILKRREIITTLIYKFIMLHKQNTELYIIYEQILNIIEDYNNDIILR